MSAQSAFIALGSNLDDPPAQVRAGIVEIARLPQSKLVASSALYRSAPVGYVDQPDFINAVVSVSTTLSARDLLDALLAIERRLGRIRRFPNSPRTLDLDLLLYGELQLDEPGLTLPHPRMCERAFVLLPLSEIAAHCAIPGRPSLDELLRAVPTAGVTRLAAAAV